MKLYLVFFFLAINVSTLKSQSKTIIAIPNKFQGFHLGSTIADFNLKSENDMSHGFVAHFTTIITKGTIVYTLTDQFTESKDKITIDLFFYHDTLSIIRIIYNKPQSRIELLADLRDKYGKEYAFDESVYNDRSDGTSQVIENFYWASECCILNFNTADEIGKVCLTFALKRTQLILSEQQAKINERKIE